MKYTPVKDDELAACQWVNERLESISEPKAGIEHYLSTIGWHIPLLNGLSFRLVLLTEAASFCSIWTLQCFPCNLCASCFCFFETCTDRVLGVYV